MAITSDRRDSPSLLLVEDDAPLSRTLSKLLQKQGLDVVCCPTAKEAVEQLDRDEFAVAILDLHLPDDDGTTLFETIHTRCPETRIIVHTGFGSFESAKKAMDYGVCAYVEKGGDPAELIDKVHLATNAYLAESLHESERRFAQIADSITEVFWLLTIDYREVLYVSPAYERIWGRSCESLYQQPQSFLEAVHPDDLPGLQAAMHRRTTGELTGESEVEFRITRPDGSERWIQSRQSSVHDEDGQVARLAGVSRDITERKQVEATLKARESQQATVAKLGQYALAGGDLSNLLDKTVEAVATMLAADFCKVLELLPDGKALLLRAGVGWKDAHVGRATVGVDQDSQAGYTLFFDDPVIVEDLATETRFSGPELLTSHGVVSGMSVVIQGYGVLGVHTKTRRTFTADDTNFIQSVANLLSEVIRRRRAGEALRAREEQYRSIFEATTDGLAVIDPNGTLVEVNPALCQMHGYTRDEFLKLQPHQFCHPDSLHQFEEFVATVNTGRTFHWEAKNIHKDDTPIDVEVYGVPFMNNGRPHLLGILQDITDRKRGHEMLRASQREFELLAESSPSMVFRADVSGKWIYVNDQQWKNFTGCPARSWGGDGWAGPIHEDDGERVVQSWQRSVANGQEWKQEFRFQHPDGRAVWVLALAVPYRNDTGEIEGLVGTCTDITERKQAEEQLRLLNTAIHDLNEGIVITEDELEWPGPKILFVNPAMTRITGYRADELIGQTPRLLQGQRTNRKQIARMRQQLSEGKSYLCDTVNYRKDGSEYDVELHVSPILDAAGKVTHFVAVHRDITEQKRIEDQLRQRDAELAHVSRAGTMGEMASALAHELTQPLGAIANYAGGCIDLLDRGDPPPADLSKTLRQINEQVLRTGKIVQRLKGFVSRTNPQRSTLDLNEVVREVEQLLLEEKRRKQVRLRLELDPHLPPLLADHIQIQRFNRSW